MRQLRLWDNILTPCYQLMSFDEPILVITTTILGIFNHCLFRFVSTTASLVAFIPAVCHYESTSLNSPCGKIFSEHFISLVILFHPAFKCSYYCTSLLNQNFNYQYLSIFKVFWILSFVWISKSLREFHRWNNHEACLPFTIFIWTPEATQGKTVWMN